MNQPRLDQVEHRAPQLGGQPDISILVPVFNEEENLERVEASIGQAMTRLGRTFEVIYVDDGSTDRSFARLEEIARRDTRSRVIGFRRNYGQTAAMVAGIHAARGQILVPMDADLQNDPEDIGRLLAKLDEGYDVVSGWRKDRKDAFVTRTLPSRIANWLISRPKGVDEIRRSRPARADSGEDRGRGELHTAGGGRATAGVRVCG
ncbi:MAG: glycosyltransferase family 2 protein, partial [Acidobacteriota bacterium]